jgi:ABC-type bacteriocin/lantibiotic exporter with double-glycine peptidase domain
LNTVRKIFSLLSRRERLQVYGLFVATLIMALFQVVGIASIAPFLSLVANPDIIHTNERMNWLYTTLSFDNETSFLIFVGSLVLAIFTFSNLFSMVTTWMLMRFSWMRNYTLSRRLLEHYLHMPYIFFLNRNSADLTKNVLAEVKEVIGGVLMPGMKMISKAVAALAIVSLLIMVEPVMAVATALILGGTYALIYAVVRRKLVRIGQARIVANREQFQSAGEALAGIKDIKLLGKEKVFLKRYANAAKRYASYRATNEVINRVPHYLIEILAFGGMLVIVLYLLMTRGNLEQVLPIIGIYALASYRLLPAIREVFTDITKVRFNISALDEIYEELQHERQQDSVERQKVPALPFRKELELKNVHFRYPEARDHVLNNFSLSIRANTSVAFVGATGSGKTTTVDVILGLLKPEKGQLLVDGVPVTDENMPNWQKNLGYVPQHIYLSDDSIASNIAFGIPEKQIDMEAVERAAKIANIHDFIVSDLPGGYRSLVGERGVRLSGGQRQRIGIARALYHDPDVLILDEATSALDGITEESVFRAVENVAKTKTAIMIAHRMSTIRGCDTIYLLEHGRIVAQGTYDELLERSPQFRTMALGKAEPVEASRKVMSEAHV